MSIDRNDPRLTAYALGDMDAAETAAFEPELDAAARAEVDAIRAIAMTLGKKLAAESAPVLTETQRHAVTAAAEPRRRWLWLVPAAAALVTVGVLLAPPPAQTRASRSAAADAPRTDAGRSTRTVQLDGVTDNLKVEPTASEYDTDEERPKVNVTAHDPMSKVTVVDQKPRKELIGYGANGPGTNADPKKPQQQDSYRGPNGGTAPGKRDPSDPQAPPPPPRATSSSSPLFFTSKLDETLKRGSSRTNFSRQPPGSEGYTRLRDNEFQAARKTSTFSIDVDTAAYSNMRRFLNAGRLPPPDAIRIEELVNYFQYRYAPPSKGSEHPFRAHVALASCPWNSRHRIARIALKGRVIKRDRRPATNLVFLIDVSGSMRPANKLPLLVQGMHLLVNQLDARDRVAIVTYAGYAGLALASTPGNEKGRIRAVLNGLGAGGSTNGAGGILRAYAVARANFIKQGANRVILATDGDFNVGVSDTGSLSRLIEKEAKSGVFLSVLGFGTGNYKDDKMEELSNRGNGNYAYIDTIREAKRALVDQLTGTLVTIAKDVKIQVFFNPAKVASYRLIGYENRQLAARDFNDDKKDAGDIGAGHTVTALYEIVPAGVETPVPAIDQNPFLKRAPSKTIDSEAMFRLRLRYKQPDSDKSRLMEVDIRDEGQGFDHADHDFRFATAVAAFGMALRGSPSLGKISWQGIHEIAAGATDDDEFRMEFVQLLKKAMAMKGVPLDKKSLEEARRALEKMNKELALRLDQAVIKSIRGKLVTISLGTNDGVKVGDRFNIERDAFIIGFLKITKVAKDHAIGEFTGAGVPRVGDKAGR